MAGRFPSGTRGHRRQQPPPGKYIIVLGVIAAVVVLVFLLRLVHGNGAARHPPTAARGSSDTAVGLGGTGRAGAAVDDSAGNPTTASRRWLVVLQAIDKRRATAWRLGNVNLLKTVYVPGSVELRVDRQMLAAYVRRGLRVSGADMRFMSVGVEIQRPRSVSLLVVDRLGPAAALDRAGHREPLPRDLPTRHRIELESVGHQWRIARITRA
jgi:hypothetical protein